MKNKFVGVCCVVGALCFMIGAVAIPDGFASAGKLREIVLGDGSVIMAEVVALKDGVYTLRSETMGELQVEDTAIQAIREPGSASGGASGAVTQQANQPPSEADVESMKQSVLGNPGLLGMVFSLRNDPDIQKILQDPEIMGSVMSGDAESLESNPKFMKLMENPKIRAIVEQMTNQ